MAWKIGDRVISEMSMVGSEALRVGTVVDVSRQHDDYVIVDWHTGEIVEWYIADLRDVD